jgi:hypothetical protein
MRHFSVIQRRLITGFLNNFKLKKLALKLGAIIFFADESSVQTNDSIGKSYSHIGQKPVIKMTGSKAKTKYNFCYFAIKSYAVYNLRCVNERYFIYRFLETNDCVS